MSVRSQIKSRMRQTLEGIRRSAGCRCEVARVDTVPRHWEQVNRFPHLFFEFESEARENLPSGRRRCRIAFRVVGYVKGRDPDALMEELTADIESALAADPTLGGLAVDCRTTEVSTTGNWETPHGMAVLSGEILYHADFQSP